MNLVSSRWVSLASGLGSVSLVLILAWAAVCGAHSAEQAYWAHRIMFLVSLVILAPIFVVLLIQRRS